MILISAALAGCMETRNDQIKTAMAANNDAYQVCVKQSPLGSARMVCLNAADARYARPLSLDPDLLDVLAATRLSVGAKVDQGQLSVTDAQLEMAKATSDIVSEETRRRNQETSLRIQAAK